MREKRPSKSRYIPILGYTHFYRSLLLYTFITPNVASRLVYELYIGNLDTCESLKSRISSPELDVEAFGRLLYETQARPYYTPVQLYRAMEHIFHCVLPSCVTGDCNRALEKLRTLSSALAERFEQVYDVDITDESTCYKRCLSQLSSYAEEPRQSINL